MEAGPNESGIEIPATFTVLTITPDTLPVVEVKSNLMLVACSLLASVAPKILCVAYC